ncbi:MAG: MerR family transcriptional regulator [Planctomycetes bacterium]|nr:MerR family transcriptional regulator [Planctomycetota bacterium]
MVKISDFMTVGEAAEDLGASAHSLRRWDATGKLKARRHPASNFRLYLRTDLDRFLAQVGADKKSPARSSPKRKKAERK